MRKQKLYTDSALEGFMKEYKKNDGKVIQLEKGTFGYGLIVCFGGGYKASIIKEVPLDSKIYGTDCAYSVRMYNEMPKKYEEKIEEYYIEHGVKQETLAQSLGRKLIKP